MEPDSVTPKAPPEIEIHWGGKVFHFKNESEALKAGFHVKDPNITKEPTKP